MISQYSTSEIWIVIISLGILTFCIRFSFLGLIGKHKLPPLAMRLLRYTPVAVLPALVAPLVVWPEATGGVLDAPRLIAAFTTLLIGYFTKHILMSLVSGASVFAFMLYIGV